MENEISQSFPDVSNFMAQTYMDEQELETQQNSDAQSQQDNNVEGIIQTLSNRVVALSDDFNSFIDKVSQSLDSILGSSSDTLNQVNDLVDQQISESQSREQLLEEKFLLAEKQESNVEIVDSLERITDSIKELGLAITKLPANDPESSFLDTVKNMPKWVIGTLIAMGVITAAQIGLSDSETGVSQTNKGTTVTPVSDTNIDGATISELISGGESGGNYDIYNFKKGKGKYGARTGNLQEMTIDEILAKQARGEIFAAGKYQMIPVTLKEAKQVMKLTGKEKFDAAMQERMFREYLIGSKRPAIRDYISGKSDDIERALDQLSLEFRSVSTKYGQLVTASKPGAGDKASIRREDAAAALKVERIRYAQNNQAKLEAPQEEKAPAEQTTKQAQQKAVEANPPQTGQKIADVSKEARQARINFTKNLINVVNSGPAQKPANVQQAPQLVPAINLKNSAVA